MPTDVRRGTDLYAVLGVDASASGDEIARAYRQRAKELHPDASPDPDAAARFQELVAAYSVLSNHRTRREHDQVQRSTARAVAVRENGGAGGVTAVSPRRWTRRRAWTAVIAGGLVALVGLGTGLLTWNLHESDARERARFDPVIATRVGTGDIMFVTAKGQVIRTREPELHGEGNGLGPTVKVRYDPEHPSDVIVDSNTVGRDVTLAIVALKLLIGGLVFVVLGARRLRSRSATAAR